MHPFDTSLGRRALLAMAIALVLTASIMVVTDEAASTMGMRAARLAALSPLVAALGALAVTAHARARGELRALEALGATPLRAAFGAAVAAWLVGALGVLVLVAPGTDGASLFPAVHPIASWIIDSSGKFATAAGAVVFDDGRIVLSSATAVHAASSPRAWAALPCLLPIALTAPIWAVLRLGALSRLLSASVCAAAVIAVLHGIAAGLLAPFAGLVAGLPLALALHAARS